MPGRFVLIAAALFTSTGAFAAEQGNLPTQANAQPQRASAQVVLASAPDIRSSPSNDSQTAPAPKPARIARVTSCRCGGDPQTVDPEGQQEQ